MRRQKLSQDTLSCLGDVGSHDDRASEQLTKTQYCLSWRVAVSKQEMQIILVSGHRRTHECESQLKEWTPGSVFGGVALLTTLLFFGMPGLSDAMLC